jgi:hypothetical protein
MTRRTSNSAQSFGAGCVGSLAMGSLAMGRRPAIRLRTIKKTAEILNIWECSVRRLHQVGRAARISDADIAALLATSRICRPGRTSRSGADTKLFKR